MNSTEGWVTKPIGRDGLGVIPVEQGAAMCPHCGMRWYVAEAPDDGVATLYCLPRDGGCGSYFRLERPHV